MNKLTCNDIYKYVRFMKYMWISLKKKTICILQLLLLLPRVNFHFTFLNVEKTVDRKKTLFTE